MPGSKSITKRSRKLGKTGNPDSPSYFITIPIELVRELNWTEGQNIDVKKSRGKIILDASEPDLKS